MEELQSNDPVDEDRLVGLIKRAQHDSDPEAFERLYLLFGDRVFRYLMAQIGDAETAEDITAHVFLRLIEKIDTFQISLSNNVAIFSGWLYRIAHNRMVDVWRAEKRYQYATLEYARQISYTASLGALEKLELEGVLQKLRSLNDQQRDVIILRFIEGLSIAETAQILGKSEAAVKALQQRALENLRRFHDV
jgi:RNA polymerase sigma-70 factor (ECF subfamily)